MQLLHVIKPQHILGILQSCVLRNDFFHAKHWNVQLIGQMNINTCLPLVHEEQAGGLEGARLEQLAWEVEGNVEPEVEEMFCPEHWVEDLQVAVPARCLGLSH